MGRMQKKAFNQIKENLKIFFDNLEVIEEGEDFTKFRGRGCVEEITVKLRIVKKLLSRIYLTVIEAHVSSEIQGSAELYVEGFISKKGIRFRGTGKIPEILNGHSGIMSTLRSIDMEEVDVRGENGKVKITVVPYSSSFVWMFIPPITYNVRLNDEEAKKLFDLIISMGDTLSKF